MTLRFLEGVIVGSYDFPRKFGAGTYKEEGQHYDVNVNVWFTRETHQKGFV